DFIESDLVHERLGVERLVDLKDFVVVHACGRSVCEQLLIDVEIAFCHDSVAESRFEFLPTSSAADFRQAHDGIHHLVLGLAKKPGHSVTEDLGYRASTSRNHGSTARQGL